MNKKSRIRKIYGHEPTDLDDLARCVISVINHALPKDNKVLGFMWNISFSQEISNSHDCPLNGTTNWGCVADMPISYPGWIGRVWIRYKTNTRSFGSDPFSQSLTYTGTGGAGAYSGPWAGIARCCYKNRIKPEPTLFSWDYRIFEDDWPELAEARQRQAVWDLLCGNDNANFHIFKWDDPETVIADREIMKNGK